MMTGASGAPFQPKMMAEADFNLLSRYISQTLGIRMSDNKKSLLESRLQKRLRTLGLPSFREYRLFLQSEAGKNEVAEFVDLITTHESWFLREPEQLQFITRSILPALFQKNRPGQKRLLNIWSAGCANGQEPYSIAMLLAEHNRLNPERAVNYSILATDIALSTAQYAKKGIYQREQLRGLTPDLVSRYMMKSKHPDNTQMRVVPELRERVTFGILNLKSAFQLRTKVDIIFCRNVMIYFNLATKQNTIGYFYQNLRHPGYLIIGGSESLHDFEHPFHQLKSSVFSS